MKRSQGDSARAIGCVPTRLTGPAHSTVLPAPSSGSRGPAKGARAGTSVGATERTPSTTAGTATPKVALTYLKKAPQAPFWIWWAKCRKCAHTGPVCLDIVDSNPLIASSSARPCFDTIVRD
jgi:hypothetical protein